MRSQVGEIVMGSIPGQNIVAVAARPDLHYRYNLCPGTLQVLVSPYRGELRK